MSDDQLRIGNHSFSSRLLVGTGKFSSPEVMRDTLARCGTQLVTVALKRADLSGQQDRFANILEFLEGDRYTIMANTAGAMNAREAVRLAHLARAAGLPPIIKLEIHPDPHYLLPDPLETYEAARILVEDGFTVLPYINADPVLALRLQEIGVAAVMPLGAPIGSNRGLETRTQVRIIVAQARVPVIVDAGLGLPSHAAAAMETGADAVLINTAIAAASDPLRMAKAFHAAVEAGREAWLLGASEGTGDLAKASPTSPLTAFLDEPALTPD